LREIDPPERGPIGGTQRFRRAQIAGRDRFITEYSGRIMKGSRICVIAMIVPVELLIIVSRLSSATRPTQTSRSLITPCCCSSTFHADVRTRSDVQNGSSTRISNRFEVLSGKSASSHATGYPSAKMQR